MNFYIAQSDEMLNNKLSDLEVLFQLKWTQICFAKSLPLTFEVLKPDGWLSFISFCFCFPNRSVTPLKLTFLALILGRH